MSCFSPENHVTRFTTAGSPIFPQSRRALRQQRVTVVGTNHRPGFDSGNQQLSFDESSPQARTTSRRRLRR